MPLAAGRLRHRLLIRKRNASGRDSSGQATVVWDEQDAIWAEIKPLRGEEREAAQKQSAATTHKITIRHRTGLAPDDRLEEHGSQGPTRTFEIIELLNINERDEAMEIMAKELLL